MLGFAIRVDSDFRKTGGDIIEYITKVIGVPNIRIVKYSVVDDHHSLDLIIRGEYVITEHVNKLDHV